MRKLRLVGWLVFILGLLFRIFHFPFSSLLLLFGTLFIFVEAVHFFSKNAKDDLPKSMAILSIAFMTMFVLFRLQFWPFSQILLVCAVGVGMAWSYLQFRQKRIFDLLDAVTVVYLLFVVALSNVRAHEIYAFFNIEMAPDSESLNCNAYVWDKYSWFLYLAGENEKALEANSRAQFASKNCPATFVEFGEGDIIMLIKHHEQLIRDRKWKSFR